MQRLNILAAGLSSCLTQTILHLSKDAEQLFSDSYPFTLTHTDLNETNVLVDPLTGHLTGVTDWVDAKIQPFGFSLYGVQNILGHMDKEGWHFCDSYKADEDLFWDTFESEVKDTSFSVDDLKKVKTAKYIGIAIRYGLNWSRESDSLSVTEDDSQLKYLNAFLQLD